MSLPWPPPPHDVAFSQMAVWDAWLVGDRTKLASAYGGTSAASRYPDFFEREGGVLPAIARFFWGRRSVSGQPRYKLHIPLAADIATASADLLFSEPPQFVLEEGAASTPKAKTKEVSPAAKRVDECLNTGDFHSLLLEAAEIAAGLGGCWLRLGWDKELFTHVMPEMLAADSGYGEWSWGKLSAVTFFSEAKEGQTGAEKIWRHLERHEPGWVLHALYQGTAAKLGERKHLQDHPLTQGLAELVNDQGAIPTKVKSLTAGYVANIRPQRRWRKIEELRELGRSDYDGVEPLMDALDEVYTSWMRDVRLAKARLLVPESFLENLGKGQGAAFDEDKEIFTQLNMLADKTDKPITPQQFEIRTEQHKATADQLIDHILESAGYSPSTFGRGEEGLATATEVVSRERQSARTRDKKTRYWSQTLEPLLSTWLELDGIVYGGRHKGEVKVVWPDASQPDQLHLAQTAQTLFNAESASAEVRVRMIHPDWDEEDVKAEVGRIQGESGRSVPDLGPFGGA